MKLLIKVIFKAVRVLINLILSPIDLLIATAFPDVFTALNKVSLFFQWLLGFIRFVLSWLPFDSDFYVFVASCLVAYYSIPLITHSIKLIVKWYNALKP